MALQANALNAACDAVTALADFVSTHTADPGGAGSNESSGGGYARQAAGTWPAASAGSSTAPATISFSGTASSASKSKHELVSSSSPTPGLEHVWEKPVNFDRFGGPNLV